MPSRSLPLPDRRYDSEQCDLCGSAEARALPLANYSRGMWSDTRLSSRPLRKLVCRGCGLVRDGGVFTPEELDAHYAVEYQLNATDNLAEHHFFRNGLAVPRSEAMAEWIAEAVEHAVPAAGVRSVYEVGAGQGALLRRLARHFPKARLAGCEVNAAAAAAAVRSGLAVVRGDERAIDGHHDLIATAFVLEHVPSPVAFLRKLSRHLNEGGRIVTAQPMQDVESHDVYFVDHLHHFATAHVEWVANRAGLRQCYVSVSPWFAPNASVHVLERQEVTPAITYVPPAAIERTVEHWEETFARCRALPRGRYALFGASEFAGLLRCYGNLDEKGIAVALDDVPERYPQGVGGVPVRALNQMTDEELTPLDAVILALNPAYHEAVTRRCQERGLRVINPFRDGSAS